MKKKYMYTLNEVSDKLNVNADMLVKLCDFGYIPCQRKHFKYFFDENIFKLNSVQLKKKYNDIFPNNGIDIDIIKPFDKCGNDIFICIHTLPQRILYFLILFLLTAPLLYLMFFVISGTKVIIVKSIFLVLYIIFFKCIVVKFTAHLTYLIIVKSRL